MSEWYQNSNGNRASQTWTTLVEMYGGRLTRDFGDSVPNAWASAIGSLQDHEVKRGIRRLGNAGSGSAPTLPQFLKACREIGDSEGPAPGGAYITEQLPDVITLHANKVMLSFMRHQEGGASHDSLIEMINAKNLLIRQYRMICEEEPDASMEIRDKLWSTLAALWKPMTPAEKKRNTESFEKNMMPVDFSAAERARIIPA